MVGIVIVSHSYDLASAIIGLTKMMAPNCPISNAGGMDDNTSFGTSYEKIKTAIKAVYSQDGVIILMDMGSAVMTTEMVLEDLQLKGVKMIDAPIVEGAIAATVSSVNNLSIEKVIEEINNTKHVKKF